MNLMGVLDLRRSFAASFIISLLLHLILAVVWICFTYKQAVKETEKKITWIDVSPVSKEKIKADNRKRIVQTTEGEKVRRAKPDSFLGDKNQSVEEQTVNRRSQMATG